MAAVLVVVALIVGAALGVMLGRFWQRAEALEEDEQRTARIAELETRLELARGAAEEDAAAAARQAEKDRADQERMLLQFKNLANEIVEERAKAFDASSKKSIGELLKPFETQLEGFQKAMAESEKDALKERASLAKQVELLTALNARVSEETQSLTRALRGDNKSQGNWGEMVLTRLLEMSGLQEGREYDTEVSVTTEEQKRRRPDVVVHLPDSRDVIIDSKVSLVHYEAFCAAEDEAGRLDAMRAHVGSIRTHVRGLAAKDYAALPGIQTVDYVLMFIPVEASFIEAMRFDHDLFQEAISKHVLIVSPSTLLAVLRTIETMWRSERQTRNAVEIAQKAGKLHDKFVLFVEALEEVGGRLDQAQDAYGKARDRLVSGRGNLVRQAKALEAMGAKANKALPQSMVEEAEEAS